MTRSTRSSGANKRATPAPSPARSPMLLLTVGAVVAGVLLVAVLAIAGGLPGGSASAVATPATDTPVALADGRNVGSPDAPIVIDVWADFQCPVCGRFTRDIESRIVDAYVADGTVRLTFRDFAFLGPESFDAAVAARVAGELGDAFWPYHDLLFANQDGENRGAFSRARLADIAVAVGLDRTAFLAAMDDPRYLAAVQAETAEGVAAGVDSTPTMTIDGKLAVGLPDWSRLDAYLQQLLAERGASPAAP